MFKNLHFHPFEQETIETFKVKTKMGDEKFEETVSINEQKEQVTYHVMAQGDLDEADILIDFKKVRAVDWDVAFGNSLPVVIVVVVSS